MIRGIKREPESTQKILGTTICLLATGFANKPSHWGGKRKIQEKI